MSFLGSTVPSTNLNNQNSPHCPKSNGFSEWNTIKTLTTVFSFLKPNVLHFFSCCEIKYLQTGRIWAHKSKSIHYVGISWRHQELKAAMYFTTVRGKEAKTANGNLHTYSCLENQGPCELKDYTVLSLDSSMMFYFSPKPPLKQAK